MPDSHRNHAPSGDRECSFGTADCADRGSPAPPFPMSSWPRDSAPAGWSGTPCTRSALHAWSASVEAHRSVLKRKGSHFIAVAFGAAWFVGSRGLNLPGQRATVRIVTIHAGHSPFRQAVFVWFLEAGPHIGVACGAQCVDFRRLARNQAVRSILVDGVAGRATHLISGMTAINAATVGGLIPM